MAENYLCHEMMKSYNGNDKVICLTFFVMSSLIFQAYEHQRIKEESCSQQHVILSCEHLPNGSPCVMHVRSKCHIDQVLLESSLDFQHFLLVHQDLLPSTAKACFGLCLHDDFYSRTERTLRQNLENIFRQEAAQKEHCPRTQCT